MILNWKFWLLRILINLVFGLLLFTILSSADSGDDTTETERAVELEPIVVTATKNTPTPQRYTRYYKSHYTRRD